jgi:hypothetical protein
MIALCQPKEGQEKRREEEPEQSTRRRNKELLCNSREAQSAGDRFCSTSLANQYNHKSDNRKEKIIFCSSRF